MTAFLRRRFWFVLALCIALAALVLILMPGEKTLGWVIKIVYLHGAALSRAGMVGFWAAGIAGLVYLIRPRPALARWTAALLLCGWMLLGCPLPCQHPGHPAHLGAVDRLGRATRDDDAASAGRRAES